MMDKNVRPLDDFYNYVNGTWMAKAVIPDDKTRWSSLEELHENTDVDVLALKRR